MNHIKNKHPNEYVRIQHEQEDLLESESKAKPKTNIADLLGCYPVEDFSQESFESAFVSLIVREDESFQLVDKEPFRSLIQLLRPSTKVPSSYTLKRRIMSSYYSKKLELTEIFKSVQMCSFTTDIWTSPSSMPSVHHNALQLKFQNVPFGVEFH